MPPKKTDDDINVILNQMQRGVVQFHVLGSSPYLHNRLTEKARNELTYPGPRKTAATKASRLKHDPMTEFRASPYKFRDPTAPTLLATLACAFKGAIASAAVDVPGAAKAKIGRLVTVLGERIPLYGVPVFHSTIVRMADMNRTPDTRFRACMPEWACKITVRYVRPILNETSIANLLGFAGMTQGIGDGRTGKGKLDFGQFEIVSPDNEDWNRIVETGGRAAQVAALTDTTFHDEESEELYNWFIEEVKRRGQGDMLGDYPVEYNANDDRDLPYRLKLVNKEED